MRGEGYRRYFQALLDELREKENKTRAQMEEWMTSDRSPIHPLRLSAIHYPTTSPPSRRIMSAKPGKLVAMKAPSSIVTGRCAASPSTSADMAMR